MEPRYTGAAPEPKLMMLDFLDTRRQAVLGKVGAMPMETAGCTGQTAEVAVIRPEKRSISATSAVRPLQASEALSEPDSRWRPGSPTGL